MEKRKLGIALGFIVTASVTGCAADFDDSANDSGVATTDAAATGSNPRLDAEFMTEVTMRPPTAGVSYTDIALGGGRVYLARSDGKVEQRRWDVQSTFVTFVTGVSWEHLDYVATGSDWNLIGSSNANRKIYRNIQNVGSPLGSYPGGVDYVWDLSAIEVVGGLQLFIIHPDSANFPVLRVGKYNTLTGMLSWETRTRSWGQYNHGLTLLNGNIYSVLNYTKSYFVWRPVTALDTSYYEAGLSPYTEHAYRYPQGTNDRFAPVGLSYYAVDDKFYGIDLYSGDQQRWVITRILKSRLMP